MRRLDHTFLSQIVLGAVITVSVITASGCSSSERKSDADAPTAEIVPNVIGEKANQAVRDIQGAGFAVDLSPEPTDRSRCTVIDQVPKGKAKPGVTVSMSLRCSVRIPDVVGKTVGQARTRIESIGSLSVVFSGGRPRNHDCYVTSQSRTGEASQFAHVRLSYRCPITQSDVREQADDLASEIAGDNNETYNLGECQLLTDVTGVCSVTYFTDNRGIICDGQIDIELADDTWHRSSNNIDCE